MHVEWESGAITADGRVVAEVDKSFWRERAEVVVDGEQWVFRSDWSRLVAESGDVVHYTASKRGMFSSHWVIEGASDTTLEIKSSGFFSSGYDILAQGAVVSQVKSGSIWSTKPQADLPDSVPLGEAVFVLWVCYTLMQRDSNSSTTTT